MMMQAEEPKHISYQVDYATFSKFKIAFNKNQHENFIKQQSDNSLLSRDDILVSLIFAAMDFCDCDLLKALLPLLGQITSLTSDLGEYKRCICERLLKPLINQEPIMNIFRQFFSNSQNTGNRRVKLSRQQYYAMLNAIIYSQDTTCGRIAFLNQLRIQILQYLYSSESLNELQNYIEQYCDNDYIVHGDLNDMNEEEIQ